MKDVANALEFIGICIVFWAITYACSGCGATLTNREEGVSEKKVTASIQYPTCESPLVDTYEKLIECIKTCTTISIDGQIYDIRELVEGKK